MKAYHQVLGEGAFERVLETGVITPAVLRVDPTWVETCCMDVVDQWIRESIAVGAPVDGLAVEAFRDMFREAARDMRAAQAEAGITVTSLETKFMCIDVLFGDVWNIFLSPFEFYFDRDKTGFVFDAEDLVARGAHVRTLDFLQKYAGVVIQVMERKAGQHIDDPRERIMAVLDELVGGFERTGEKALETMRLAEKEGPKDGSDMEFVWKEGALPIDWAIEVWEKGKLITPY